MSKTNGTAAADAITREADHQTFLANNLALDLGNRMASYREKTEIKDWFVVIGSGKALVAAIIAMSESEEQAMKNFQHLIAPMVGQIKQGWADRVAAEAAQQGGQT